MKTYKTPPLSYIKHPTPYKILKSSTGPNRHERRQKKAFDRNYPRIRRQGEIALQLDKETKERYLNISKRHALNRQKSNDRKDSNK